MKRRNIVLSLVLVFTVLLFACGTGDPFEGKWKGTLDVTKQFEDGVIANYPDIGEYVDFEDLVFTINIEFTDGTMSMSVDPDSVDAFMVNFEAGMKKIAEEALLDYLESMDMTMEEVVFESGMTEEEYMENVYRQMQIDSMTESMKTVTNDSLAGLSKINGTYTYNDEEINLRYETNVYESFAYSFDGDDLTIIVRGDGFSLHIECEAQK